MRLLILGIFVLGSLGNALLCRSALAHSEPRVAYPNGRRPISTLTPDKIDLSDFSRFLSFRARQGCTEVVLTSDIEQKLSWNTDYAAKKEAWSGPFQIAGFLHHLEPERSPAGLSVSVPQSSAEIGLKFDEDNTPLNAHKLSRLYLKDYTAKHSEIFAYLVIVHDLVSQVFEGQVRSIHSVILVLNQNRSLEHLKEESCERTFDLNLAQVGSTDNTAFCRWVWPQAEQTPLCW